MKHKWESSTCKTCGLRRTGRSVTGSLHYYTPSGQVLLRAGMCEPTKDVETGNIQAYPIADTK